MEAIEEYDRGACTIALHYDTDSMSPRDWCQLGTIVTWGREGGWGDDHLRYEPWDTDYTYARWAVRYREEHEATVILPVFFHDYGGGWGSNLECGDVGDWLRREPDGAIFDTPEGRETTGATDIEACLRGECDEMTTYFRGEVYGYVVERDGIHIESCWGFMGDDGLAEARSQAEFAADHETANAARLGTYELAH